MDAEIFITTTLRRSPYRETITRVLAAALQAVDPADAVATNLQRTTSHIVIGEKSYPLAKINDIYLIAFGKASLPMSRAAAEILGDRLRNGIVIIKASRTVSSINEYPLTILSASHPIPDEGGIAGAQHIIKLLHATTPQDLILFLISGGGSALLTSPADGIALDDLTILNRELLACGATIQEINTLRKHLSNVKGGQLAQQAYPAQYAALILSDVIGDPLDSIASGPTVPDPSTYADALAVIARYALDGKLPAAILHYLQKGSTGEIPETPKPGNPVFARSHNLIIGNNQSAARAALAQAQAEGLNALLLTTRLQGEAHQIGPFLAAIAQQIHTTGDPVARPACLVAGGETTVTLRGHGLGGRNQEMALSAVSQLAGLSNTFLIALASDGEDGPTDAAGAVISGETLFRATQFGLAPETFLARNDAYHFFELLGDLIKTGPTYTNVNDLCFVFTL